MAEDNLIDLAPTLADLARAEPLPDTDGKSLWSELCQGQLDGRDVFAELSDLRPTCHGIT